MSLTAPQFAVRSPELIDSFVAGRSSFIDCETGSLPHRRHSDSIGLKWMLHILKLKLTMLPRVFPRRIAGVRVGPPLRMDAVHPETLDCITTVYH